MIRVFIAQAKWRFLRRHLFDLLTVAVPILRPLRVVRLLTVIRVVNRKSRVSLRGKVGAYAALVTALVGFCAALAVLDAERHAAGANITNFPEALWWTLTTLTTVGYGDLYPATWEGRLVAAGLMVGGIALLGTITGMIASWFIDRFQEPDDRVREETDALREEITRLRAELAARESGGTRSFP